MQNPSESPNEKPAAEPSPDDERRSDANDGVERPLGFYSTQAQADRNRGTPGATPTNETADGPGFYSPEQQAARNRPDQGDLDDSVAQSIPVHKPADGSGD